MNQAQNEAPARQSPGKFVVAVPVRYNWYTAYSQALSEIGALRFYGLGTRRGAPGVPEKETRLNPWIGLVAYAGNRLLSPFAAESFRFRLLPWFDRWVLKHLQAGDHVISSFGFTNECFEFARGHGGKALLDAGNSHPQNFWETIGEEHRRWNCPYPAVPAHWHRRSVEMLDHVDYVLSPSAYVTNSFLARGFRPGQILKVTFPVDLSLFHPAGVTRPKDRALTVINTGSLSLRKGTPYLLQAFREILKTHPSARLKLIRIVQDDVKPILARFADLPIDWFPPLGHQQLAELLRSADVFVLPSLEEGMARSGQEALACGLQVVLTPNTGTNDLVQPGVSGEIVPIRDPKATAEAILRCAERVMTSNAPPKRMIDAEALTFERFRDVFLGQLKDLGLVAKTAPGRESGSASNIGHAYD